MRVNLKSADVAELTEAKARITARLEELALESKREAAQKIEKLAREAGFKSAAEALKLTRTRKVSKPRGTVAPRYIASDGSATWTGRGRKPRWFEAGNYREIA